MDQLEFEDIIEGLSNGKYQPSYIMELFDNNQLNHLSRNEIEEIALSFNNDDDKISMLKYVFATIKIIKTLKNEESIVKAIGVLRSDEEKAKVAVKFLTNDENRLKAIKEIKDEDKAFTIKLLLSREHFKKYFFKEEDKKYSQIGLDKDITFGVEIESIGDKSQTMLETAQSNGKKIHKEKGVECGQIIKRRRRYIVDNYGRR